MKPETIIKIGGEGGCIEIYGYQYTEGKWAFFRERNESALADFIEEDTCVLQSSSSLLYNWEEALNLLDQYPWVHLYPVAIHPAFKNKIWQAVQQRTQQARLVEKWRKACFGTHT